jgi:hypothetical protein
VTLEFINKPDGVIIKANQVGVPVGQEEIIRRNWMGYYWNPIKDSYGRLQSIPFSSDPLFGVFDQSWLIGFIVALIVLLISFTTYAVAPSLKF